MCCTYATQQQQGDVDVEETVSEKHEHAAATTTTKRRIYLDVHSPQFRTIFHYWLEFSPSSSKSIQIVPRNENAVDGTTTNNNMFVEKTLTIALTFIQRHNTEHFCNIVSSLQSTNSIFAIKLRADNDFYSQAQHMEAQGLDLTPGNISNLPNFLMCPVDKETGALVVHKTGMGSSAALVTSLVGALLRYFDVISLPTASTVAVDDENISYGIKIVHNLSQLCHSIAQGKVGSGFDVSSAVYGNHAYTRFDQALLAHVLMSNNDDDHDNDNHQDEDGTKYNAAEKLYAVVTDMNSWDCTVQPMHLPKGVDLLMADVCGGSESPSMARKILKWKRERVNCDDDNEDLWEGLRRGNDDVWQCLQSIARNCTQAQQGNGCILGGNREFGLQISKMNVEQWRTIVRSHGSDASNNNFSANELSILSNIVKLSDTLRSNRLKLKCMGEAADNVPVEPDEQTKLADATMEVDGVIACGVPGAGGHDALFVLYVQGESTDDEKSDVVRDAIAELWRSYSSCSDELKICPLSVRCAEEEWGGIRESALEW